MLIPKFKRHNAILNHSVNNTKPENNINYLVFNNL